MQLNLATDNAIRAILLLAEHGGCLTGKKFATQPEVSPNYIGTTLKRLRAVGLVYTQSGGCRLNKPPDETSLYDVMTAVNELFHPATSPPEATDGESLYERETDVMLTIQNGLRTALRGITLDSFCSTPTAQSRAPTCPASFIGLLSTASPKDENSGKAPLSNFID